MRRVSRSTLSGLLSRTALLTALLTALHAPAQAQVASASTVRAVSERVSDAGGVLVCEALGALAGVIAGAGVGALVDPPDGDQALPEGAILGATVGLLVGNAGGLLAFDALSDGDGSVAAGLVGQGVGVGLVGLGIAMEREELFLAGLGTAVLGGVIGYALQDRVTTQPLVSALPDGQGGTRYTLGLGGRF